jgi:hypothetical protein
MLLVVVPALFQIILLTVLAITISSARKRLLEIDYSRKSILKLQSCENKLALGLVTIINDAEGTPNQLRAVDSTERLLESEEVADLCRNADPELVPACARMTLLNRDFRVMLQSAKGLLSDSTIPTRARIRYIPMFEAYKAINALLAFSRQVVLVESKSSSAEPKELMQIRRKLSIVIGCGVSFGLMISVSLALFFRIEILQRLKNWTLAKQNRSKQ